VATALLDEGEALFLEHADDVAGTEPSRPSRSAIFSGKRMTNLEMPVFIG
jgi:hypothetical protein